MEKTCIECSATFTGKRKKTCCRVCAFWSLYDKSGGPDACWNWQGYVNPRSGYGMANNDIAGKRISAHRQAWKLANLCDPDKLHILHKCDNRLCGNPAHLKIGTPRSNLLDAWAKGRPMQAAPGEDNSHAKLNIETVKIIREATESASELAQHFGVAPMTIRRIRKGSTWRHILPSPADQATTTPEGDFQF